MPMRFYPSRPSQQEGRVEVRLNWDIDAWPPKPIEIQTDEQPDAETENAP